MNADRPIRILAARAVRRVSFTLTMLSDTKEDTQTLSLVGWWVGGWGGYTATIKTTVSCKQASITRLIWVCESFGGLIIDVNNFLSVINVFFI